MNCPLDGVIDGVRPALADIARTTKERIRLLWSAAKEARNLGSYDVVRDAFTELAIETDLIDRNGWWTGQDVRKSVRRDGAEDVEHTIRWALRGSNPFETVTLE
jgi:hypothetical protein